MKLRQATHFVSMLGLAGLGLDCTKDDVASDTRSRVSSSANVTNSAPLPPEPTALASAPAPSVSAEVPEPITEAHEFKELSELRDEISQVVSSCPENMVKVPGREGPFCIDQYESSMFDTKTGRRASPFYEPTKYGTGVSYKKYVDLEEGDAGTKSRLDIKIPEPPDWQLEHFFRVKAVPTKGVLPNAYVSGVVAKGACRNAGKRLCTEDEWLTACRGEKHTKYPYGNEYKEGACNMGKTSHPVFAMYGGFDNMTDPRLNLVRGKGGIPLLEKTGSRTECFSKWGDSGIYDMVGNLAEWVSKNKPKVVDAGIGDAGADADAGDAGDASISDASIVEMAIKKKRASRGVFNGGFYMLSADGNKDGDGDACKKREDAHGHMYTDYSIGTRCCSEVKR